MYIRGIVRVSLGVLKCVFLGVSVQHVSAAVKMLLNYCAIICLEDGGAVRSVDKTSIKQIDLP